jgi:ATP-dependent Clp protease ATP-binding subunit ClpB
MNLNEFTNKAQEAITSCKNLLVKFGHSQATPEHLMLACLEQEDGIAGKILERLELKPGKVIKELTEYLDRQPKNKSTNTTKDEIHISNKLMRLLHDVLKEANKLTDEFVSVEHLMLAFCDSKNQTGAIFKRNGVTRERMLKVLPQIRENKE